MADRTVAEIPVVWLQGTSCSGCSISLLNSASPSIANVLLEEIVPGKHVALLFHPTVMAASGTVALEVLEGAREASDYVLMVEGGIPTLIGEIGGRDAQGKEIDFVATFNELADKAMAVVAVGQCATYGGIPASEPNPSGSVSVEQALKNAGLDKPFINVPGCPPHPDWIVGTVAYIILNGLPGEDELDEFGRLKLFFGGNVHENCPRRPDFDAGKFAKHFSDQGCLYELGCKGPVSFADCPLRQWNNGVNWCIRAGSPCHACVEPGFPNIGPGLYVKIVSDELPRLARDDEGRLVPVGLSFGASGDR